MTLEYWLLGWTLFHFVPLITPDNWYIFDLKSFIQTDTNYPRLVALKVCCKTYSVNLAAFTYMRSVEILTSQLQQVSVLCSRWHLQCSYFWVVVCWFTRVWSKFYHSITCNCCMAIKMPRVVLLLWIMQKYMTAKPDKVLFHSFTVSIGASHNQGYMG